MDQCTLEKLYDLGDYFQLLFLQTIKFLKFVLPPKRIFSDKIHNRALSTKSVYFIIVQGKLCKGSKVKIPINCLSLNLGLSIYEILPANNV